MINFNGFPGQRQLTRIHALILMGKHMKETCRNPWNEACRNTDILLYIKKGKTLYPICRACWNKIADSDVEWSEKQVEEYGKS